MVPANKAEALAGLASVWGDRPETQVGHVILDLVAENLDSRFLPLSAFFEATNSVRSDQQLTVLNVVHFFAGAGVQLLTLQLEYIDDDEVILLDDDAAKAASEHNINPVTGEQDNELNTKLFICYAPSDVARRALRK
ncbi:hypothetical protein CJO66_21675 [Burkholderia ubonensis]|uniref:hypothetical protein n=1 Tax=Burkholderia ubonensis TaxID=101571 RepID=UPI000BA6623C|nr:hypothetical protein [Burkholderia ubonensis]PAK12946.1 hypothetical protein CJO66_21675 [Burkholderia ubonensis]RQP95719.1 hypothetical protein DF009_12580 [Burkholderia ubonensis]